MGNSSSTEAGSKIDAAVNKASAKTEKVLKNVSGTINSTASDVKKTVNKAANKSTSTVNKAAKDVKSTAKDVKKTVSKAVSGSSDKKDREHLTEVAIALPIVALAIAVGVYLWKEKPWKKSGGSGGAQPKK